MPLFSIINVVIFQLAWFSAALLKDNAIIVMLLLLVIHMIMTTKRQVDIYTVMLILPIGIASELLLLSTGLLSYQSQLILPVWMVLLWVHLSLSLNHSLEWMQKIPVVWQSVLAALAGAGSYAAAANLGAINLPGSQVTSLLLIALVWALQLPFMMKVARHVKLGRLTCPI
ncbi:DUF2878 domain-containing protein [Leucothrix pacifica]|nr:DUF2878 domain-containing protein [Leucothrix pacifica]